MVDDLVTEVSAQKVVIDSIVRGGISIAVIVGSYFFFKDAQCFVDHSDQHDLQILIFVFGFVPWLFILATLWKVRRRRDEGLLAEAEDLLLVGGVLWMELAFLGWNAFHMHFGAHGREMFCAGIFAPLILSIPSALHTTVGLCRNKSFWRSVPSGLFLWLAASTPSIVAWEMMSGWLQKVDVMEGWFLSHAVAFAAAYAAVLTINSAKAPPPREPNAGDHGVLRELPFDRIVTRYAGAAGALILCCLLYPIPFQNKYIDGFAGAYFIDWIGMLIPWLYWTFLVLRLRREMCIADGDSYKNKVRMPWLLLMLPFIVIPGWLSPAAAFIPLQMVLPLLAAIGVMCCLSSYLASSCTPKEWLRPAMIMAAGLVLPAVTHWTIIAASQYAIFFKNPMLLSFTLAAGDAMVFFGLYQLRETLRRHSVASEAGGVDVKEETCIPQVVPQLVTDESSVSVSEVPIKSESTQPHVG